MFKNQICSRACYFKNIQKSLINTISTRNDHVEVDSHQNSIPSSADDLHVYKNVQPYKNINELLKYVIDNIIYNKDGLVALNKPYGLGVNKPNYGLNRFHRTAGQSFVPETNFVLCDVMNDLKAKLNMPELSIIKSPEKYTSGIVLLGSDESVVSKVRKSFSFCKSLKKPHMKFWCVTKGCPKPSMGEESLLMKIIKEDKMKYVQLSNYVKSQAKKEANKSVHTSYRTLSSNDKLSVALMEIDSTSAKWHFQRLYMIRKGAYILGDTLYSNRISRVLNKTVVLENSNSTANQTVLPHNICKLLKVSLDNGLNSIPVQLHLHKYSLPNLSSFKTDIEITAPLPEHMLWTCKKLDLISSTTKEIQILHNQWV